MIEDADGIYDYINTEVRKEWEEDAKSEHRDPNEDALLKSLARRSWMLEVVEIARIKLNPDTMNYVDPQRGYDFSKSLAARSKELRESMKLGASVIRPVIVAKEDMMLVDGYCLYATLKAMNVSETLAYIGTL